MHEKKQTLWKLDECAHEPIVDNAIRDINLWAGKLRDAERGATSTVQDAIGHIKLLTDALCKYSIAKSNERDALEALASVANSNHFYGNRGGEYALQA